MREIQSVAATAASLKVDTPPLAKEVCQGAPLPKGPAPSEPDYQVFGILQTGMLEICDTKRALAVQAAELHNTQVDALKNELRPLSFWERLFGRRR